MVLGSGSGSSGSAPHASHILFIDGNYASTSAIASSLYKFGVLFDVLSAA